jgi:hypothetical protein
MTRRKRKSSALRANGTSHIWLSSHFSREAFMVFSHRLAFTVNDASQSAGPESRRGGAIRYSILFPDIATANAFRNRFGGECLTRTRENPATSSDAPEVARQAEDD